MEIKKKVKKSMSKAKEWCGEHKKDIIMCGIHVVGTIVIGGSFYILGTLGERSRITKRFNDRWEWTDGVISVIDDSKTGKLDAIMNKRLSDAFCYGKEEIIHDYENGTWKYASDVQK